MKTDFKEAAEKYAKEMYLDTDDGYPSIDFDKGAQYGFSEAMKQHREFYLAVREYILFLKNNDRKIFTIDDLSKLRMLDCLEEVDDERARWANGFYDELLKT